MTVAPDNATEPAHGAGAVDRSAPDYPQTVLVFKAGGALGAYLAGVYQALQEAGIEPDSIS
ncbi:MAG TPA: hypothetical protein VK281_11455 [Xanthobacteraceae bacterium]|nr:hypothetical protein [Xanthobacteraceae bacterium]